MNNKKNSPPTFLVFFGQLQPEALSFFFGSYLYTVRGLVVYARATVSDLGLRGCGFQLRSRVAARYRPNDYGQVVHVVCIVPLLWAATACWPNSLLSQHSAHGRSNYNDRPTE